MTVVLYIWLVGMPVMLAWMLWQSLAGNDHFHWFLTVLFIIGWPIVAVMFGWGVLNERLRRTP